MFSADSQENLDNVEVKVEGEKVENNDSYLYQHQSLREMKITHSLLEHRCAMDIDHESHHVRQTTIICTIGPSCDTKEKLKQMILSGMNIARLNLTLGGYDYHTGVIQKIREVEKEMDMSPLVAIAVDITTPTIRTGFIHGDPDRVVTLTSGSFIDLTTDEEYRNASNDEVLWIDRTYMPNVMQAIKIGDRILIDDGAISVIVRERVTDFSVRCLVEQGGPLGSSVRLGLPRKTLYQHFVVEKYRQDLLFAVENEVDMIFASYIENGDDVMRVKHVLGQIGQNIKLIARIETHIAIQNIMGIIAAADGVLIARGDLGLELPPQKVFLAQKSIIARCNRAKVPAIVATQMLESMRWKPRPTRAEVSDVANAILDGADALVVTVETAKGNYPLETVQFLHRIAREAEAAIYHNQTRELKQAHAMDSMAIGGSRSTDSPFSSVGDLLSFGRRSSNQNLSLPVPSQPPTTMLAANFAQLNITLNDHTQTAALSAVEAASTCTAAAILVVTTTGRSAQLVTSFRPACPILTIVRRAQVGRQCHLHRGLHPILYAGVKADDWSEDMDLRIHYGINYGRQRGFLQENDAVVVITGSRAGTGSTNTVRIISVPPAEHDEPLRIVRSQMFQKFDD